MLLAESVESMIPELRSVVVDEPLGDSGSTDDVCLYKLDNCSSFDFRQGNGFGPFGEVVCHGQDEPVSI